MMKKILNIILFSLFLMVITTNSVYGNDLEFDQNIEDMDAVSSGGGGGGWVPTGPPAPKPRLSYENPNTGKEYYCEYLYGINTASTITVDGYDMEGNSLMEYTFAVEDTFKSGTWIGLRSQETKTADWNITYFKCYEVTYNYTCEYVRYDERTIVGDPIYDGKTYECTNLSQLKTKQEGRYATKSSCNNKCGKSNEWDSTNRACYCITEECSNWKPVPIGYTQITIKDELTEPRTYYNMNKYFTCPATDNFYGITYEYNRRSTETITKETGEINEIRTQVVKKAKAEAEASLRNATADIEYINTNKYPNQGKAPTDWLIAKGKGIEKIYEDRYSGTLRQIFLYRPEHVCLNSKTAEVKYKNDNCDEEKGELDITTGEGKDGKTFWRYFIPLNTKTGSEFFIRVKPKNARALKEGQCRSMVKNYPLKNDYTYHIKKLNGGKFEGIVSKDKENITKSNGCLEGNTRLTTQECIDRINKYPLKNDYTNYIKNTDGTNFVGDYIFGSGKPSVDKEKIKGGCILSTAVNFNIEQEFYKENTSNGYLSLKGYNMYFRQININNPFPNGIDTSTYWKGIYNSSNNSVKVKSSNNVTKEEKLTDSYEANKITYIAENLSKSKIKNNTAYTSWEKMQTNGFSENIGDTIKRKNYKTPYLLGCGPANIDWEVCK